MSVVINGTTGITTPAGVVLNNYPAFSAYLGTNQSVSSSTYTKIQCNVEEFDTNSNYDNATNYRFQPTIAGYYQINGTVNVGTSLITRGIVYLYKNGVGFKRGNDLSVGNSMNVSAVVLLNGTTDYLELYGYVTATTPLFYSTDTYFSGVLVRAA